jgi:hypothetical protein
LWETLEKELALWRQSFVASKFFIRWLGLGQKPKGSMRPDTISAELDAQPPQRARPFNLNL